MKMMMTLAALLAANTVQAGVWAPTVEPIKIGASVGQAPVETAVPLLESLERFRMSRVTVPLGGKDYRVALQLTRGDEWAVSLIEAGKTNPHELEASSLLSVIEKHPWKRNFDGEPYTITLDGPELHFAHDENDLAQVRVPLTQLRRAAWDAGVPVPTMGAAWKVVFQVDLWRGAGMRSFTFLEAANGGIVYHRLGAETVDSTEWREKSIGSTKIWVKIGRQGEKYVLLIRDQKPE